MEKIKENLGLFFIIWAVVLFLNQIILFGSCLAPTCLITALPHTGIITFVLFILIIKDNENKNIDTLHDWSKYHNKLNTEQIKQKDNLKKEVDIKEIVQPIQINNPFYPRSKNLQDEVKINKTLTKSNIRDIPYPLSVPFQMILKDIKNTTLQIDIDNREYLITRPVNNSWKKVSLKNGDVCVVEKISYSNEKKLGVKLNLLEINAKKNISMEKSISIFNDNELLNLKQQLKKLETKFQELIEKKTEYLNNIEEFNTQYNLHLGELIKAILNLKKEILYKKIIKNQKLKEQYKNSKDIYDETKQTIEELKKTIVELEEILETLDKDNENYEEINSIYNEIKEELRKLEDEFLVQEKKLEKTEEQLKENEIFEEEYEDAKSTYEEFEEEYEHIKDTQKDIIKLDEEQQKELKILYKKAAKLCHPDIVANELKEKALEIMQSLNDAYSKKNIEQVKRILLSLENGTTFKTVSSDIEDKELLISKIKEFEQNISDLEDEIEEIKLDNVFVTISKLDDWDEYFEELKNELTEQKANFEKEILEVLKDENKDIPREIESDIKDITIQKENSDYSNTINSIEVPNFEKIRRYCNNLLSDNQADDMQEYLANNGKMYKAIIYDALEQFISKLDGQTITLVDWGCGQGIASMVVLDYIKEKQLKNIKVSNSILIDDDIKALSRAMVHSNVLSYSDDIKISAYHLNSDISDILEKLDNQTVLNLMVNDRIHEKIENIDFENDYFLCLSNQSNVNIDKFYKKLNDLKNVQDMSIRDCKIGKFQKFERIFKVDK